VVVRTGVPRVALLVSAGLAVAAFAVVAVSASASTSPPAAAAPDPVDPLAAAPWADELPPTPEPEPEPDPEPVVGRVEAIEVLDLSTAGTRVFQPRSAGDTAVPTDEAAVADLVASVAAAFDDHLTALQTTDPDAAEPPALAGVDVLPVTSTLADPQRWVETATYHARVGARGGPEWLELTVEVLREEGTSAARFVVVPGEPPRLLAAEVLR
jgi:hypothetical protein